MSDVVNVRVKVTNLLDQTTTGLIHSFNPSQSILALKLEPSKIRILNTAFIKAVQVVQPHKHNYHNHKAQHPRLSKVDLRKLEADLNEAIAKYKPFEANQTSNGEKDSDKHPHPSKNQQHSQNSQKPQSSSHPQRQHQKRRDSTSHAHAQTIFNGLASKFGKENVQWISNDAINVYKDVVIAKPYTLNKMGGKKSPKAEEVKNALRAILLDVGPGKRGG